MGGWGTADYDRVAIEIRDAAGGAGDGQGGGVTVDFNRFVRRLSHGTVAVAE